jgi:hypothetical protein
MIQEGACSYLVKMLSNDMIHTISKVASGFIIMILMSIIQEGLIFFGTKNKKVALMRISYY